MNNRDYYIDKYNDFIERERQNFIEINGSDNNFCDSNCIDSMENPEQIAGYLISWYSLDYAYQWNSLKKSGMLNLSKEVIEEVTNILMNVEYPVTFITLEDL